MAATLATQNRTATKAGGRAQNRMIADDREIIRAGREPKLGRNVDRSGSQMNRSRLRKAEGDEQRKDQALFYLAWRLSFAAFGFRLCAMSLPLRPTAR